MEEKKCPVDRGKVMIGLEFCREQDRSSFNIDVNRLMKVRSEIMSEKYGCKVTMTAVKKEDK